MNNHSAISDLNLTFKDDIYFKEQYYKLFEVYGDGEYQVFKYSDQSGRQAYYPFLKNNLESAGINLRGTYYDIQSAYGYGGVISNSYDPLFIEAFYNEFNSYCKLNNIIAEFTRFHPILENHKFSQNHMTVLFDRKTVALNLTSPFSEIWEKQYSSKNRNMIRKAIRKGYSSEVVDKPSPAEIDQFYQIYCYNMEKVGAERYYFFNRDFFNNTFEYFPENSLLLNVKNGNGEIICSSIFFNYNCFFHYHLSGRTANADNSVNNYLLDEAVKYAQTCKAKVFHLGGGRSNAPDDKLLKFKQNFSKVNLSFFIGKKIHDKKIYDEVVHHWESRNPEKKEKYSDHILKYRF